MLQPCTLWLSYQSWQVVAYLVDFRFLDVGIVGESRTISSCMAVLAARGVRF